MLLERLSWPEIDSLDRGTTVVIIPVGAIEQHGPHLPLNTDAAAPAEMALAVSEALESHGDTRRVLVAPTVPWGMSSYHMGFPGTISLRSSTLEELYVDIADSLIQHGFTNLLFLNGHGGNGATLFNVLARIETLHQLRPVAISYWDLIREVLVEQGTSDLGGMGHAGELETSLQLFLNGRVHIEKLKANIPPWDELTSIDFRNRGLISVPWNFSKQTEEGVLGDPTHASAEKGHVFFSAAVSRIISVVKWMIPHEE